jgi:hypothetical protein
MHLEGKTALVTGSTDGVSRLVACRLADQGAHVLVHGRDRRRGEQVLEQMRATGRGSAIFLPADLSALAEVRRLAEVVRQNCNRLDILVNNAGIGSGGSAGSRPTSRSSNAVAHRVGLVLDEIKMTLLRVDDNGAGRLLARGERCFLVREFVHQPALPFDRIASWRTVSLSEARIPSTSSRTVSTAFPRAYQVEWPVGPSAPKFNRDTSCWASRPTSIGRISRVLGLSYQQLEACLSAHSTPPYLPRFMAGGPGNPLGARAMYLGNTVYRIHGTNAPETIGQAVSSGCFRLVNDDVIDLYGRVNVGTKVIDSRDRLHIEPRSRLDTFVLSVNALPIRRLRHIPPKR